ARSRADWRWSTAWCCWSTPRRVRCRRPGSCFARHWPRSCRSSWWSTRSTGRTHASRPSSTTPTNCSSTWPTTTLVTPWTSRWCTPARRPDAHPWSVPPTARCRTPGTSAPGRPRPGGTPRAPGPRGRPRPVPDPRGPRPLFATILEHTPAPPYDEGAPLQAHVTNLDASPYLGRLALCRVINGELRRNQSVAWCRADGTVHTVKLSEMMITKALDREPAEIARPGDIVA